MLIRRLSVFLLCLTLAGCAAIEIDSNPVIPRPHQNPEARRAAEVPTSATAARTPAAGALPTAADLAPTSGPLNITVEGAILLALANNKALKVDEFNPALRKTFEAEERAAFDPTLSANYTYSSSRAARTVILGGTATDPALHPAVAFGSSRQNTGAVALSEFLPTGTNINLGFAETRVLGTDSSSNLIPSSARAGLSVSQQLLRGASISANLASLHQAQIDTLASEYELRGFSQTMVSNVEQAYWDYLYAERQVKILEDALVVAEQQLKETQDRIRFGKLPASERFSAEAEVALRREALINGRSLLEQARLALLRLVSLPGDALRPRPINLMSEPILPAHPYDNVEDQIALAMRMRPDLNQARLAIKRDELEIVKTRNGLLPALQLFVNLGKTGYADSFGGAVSDISGNGRDLSTGLTYSYALGNRAARASYRRSILSRDQQIEALRNMAQLVEQDVRGAVIEIDRVREQVTATAVTRQLQQETLRTEQEKFHFGRSTSLAVAQAERDLLTAQISELQAFVAYLKSVVTLYRLDGSLLDRRGVVCPGNQPVQLPQDYTE